MIGAMIYIYELYTKHTVLQSCMMRVRIHNVVYVLYGMITADITWSSSHFQQ